MKLTAKLVVILSAVLLASLGVVTLGLPLASHVEGSPASSHGSLLNSGRAVGSIQVASASSLKKRDGLALWFSPAEPPVDSGASSDADSGVSSEGSNSGETPTSTGASGSSVEASHDELSGQQTVGEPDETSSSTVLVPLEQTLLQLVDEQRSQAGFSHLELDDTLVQLARIRSQDMASKNYFSHTAPDGSSARDLMIAARIGPGLMGEILGRNNSSDSTQSVQSVVDAFMNSPSHKAAIMNPRFVSAGVGTAIGPDNMKYYTVLFFGQ